MNQKLLLLMGLALCAFGDQITLKNGDRVTGKVVSSDEKVLVLKTDYAGDLKIDRTMITSITTDGPLNVTLKDAGKVQAKVGAAGDGVKVEKTDGSVVTVQPEALTALRDDASQKAYEREQERLHHPRLNDFWSGFVSLGVANSSGNASTTSISTAASANRVAGKNNLQLNFVQIYARQSTTLPYGETANRLSGGVRIGRDVSGKLFVYGNNSYDYDKFLDLNLRVVLGGGFGYHAWKSKKGFLDVTGGGNWNRETFDVTSRFTTYTTESRNSAEVTVGQEAGYQAFNRVKLWEKLSFFPNLTNTGEYRMNFDSTAAVPVMKWLELNVGFSSRYLSNPLLGRKAADTIFTTGVRVAFDQTKR
jgi:putative salt-induced outer membrane protein YdiY